jgi:hypothetical protein
LRLFIFITLFFWGCSDAPIYKSGEVPKDLNCVNPISLFEEDIETSKEFFTVLENCKYDLIIEPHLTHNCNNPHVKSLGSDFDGYVSIKIIKDEKEIFRSQTDFKGDNHIPHLRRLLSDIF